MRTFIAIPLSDEVFEALKNLQRPVDGIAWQAAQPHITLHFFGETPQTDVTTLRKKLEGIQHSAFSLTIQGIGCFFKDDSPTVIWAGIKRNDALVKLYTSIEKVVWGMGFPASDHSFKPHITLGRVKNTPHSKEISAFINSRKKWGRIHTVVDCFVLYNSLLSEEGAEYVPLKTYTLKR